MKVILRKDIKKLGSAGAVKDVKDGFARNYLLPKKLVEEATEGALKNWELGAKSRKAKQEKAVGQYKELAKTLDGKTFGFIRAVGEDSNIFGSVSKLDIQKQLKKEGFEVDKDAIEISAPIKTLGETEVAVSFHHGVAAKIKINISAAVK